MICIVIDSFTDTIFQDTGFVDFYRARSGINSIFVFFVFFIESFILLYSLYFFFFFLGICFRGPMYLIRNAITTGSETESEALIANQQDTALQSTKQKKHAETQGMRKDGIY